MLLPCAASDGERLDRPSRR